MQVVVQPSSNHRWLSSKWVWQILAAGLTPPTCALYCVICLDAMWFYPRCELWFDSRVICLVQCSLPWCDINCDAIPSEMWNVIWFHLRFELWYDFMQELCVLPCTVWSTLTRCESCCLNTTLIWCELWCHLIPRDENEVTKFTFMPIDVICQVYFIKNCPSATWSELWCFWLPNVFYNNGDEGNNGDDPWQCNVTYRILDLLGENVAHTQKILRILRMHIARNIWHTWSQSAQNIWYIHTKYDITCTQNTPHL